MQVPIAPTIPDDILRHQDLIKERNYTVKARFKDLETRALSQGMSKQDLLAELDGIMDSVGEMMAVQIRPLIDAIKPTTIYLDRTNFNFDFPAAAWESHIRDYFSLPYPIGPVAWFTKWLNEKTDFEGEVVLCPNREYSHYENAYGEPQSRLDVKGWAKAFKPDSILFTSSFDEIRTTLLPIGEIQRQDFPAVIVGFPDFETTLNGLDKFLQDYKAKTKSALQS